MRKVPAISSVAAIYSAAQSRGVVSEHQAVQVKAGCGIVGDRHYRFSNAPESQLTLIEREAVEAFNDELGLNVSAASLRRNILTEGIALNPLVGKVFYIGTTMLRGIERCDPCSVVGKLLQQAQYSPRDIIRALTDRGGLRAEILSDGVICAGTPITLDLPDGEH